MPREYLTTPLERVADDGRSVQGMFQSDIVIRTAILTGIADMRENPDLLDYVFASLPKDDLTFRQYGKEQVELAKKWFLNTEIPVYMNTRVDESKVPCITIGLSTSAESASVLGDVHYETVETALDETPIVYGGPYTPQRYIPASGVVIMRGDFDLDVFPDQFIRDSHGKLHRILDVLDAKTFIIEPNLNTPLTNCYFVSEPAKKTVSLETVEFREVYEIGCHAMGEPTHLAYLSSILGFILLRYKEELLEARGLTRSTVSAGPVVLNTSFNVSQPVFTRMFTLTGFVFHTWPKQFGVPIVGVVSDIKEINQDSTVGDIWTVGVEVDLSDLDNLVVDNDQNPVTDNNSNPVSF